MENISIHPHKGYLNTTFSIFTQNSSGKELFIKHVNPVSDKVNFLETLPTHFKITDDKCSFKYTPNSPGKYVVGISGEDIEYATFVVEDAVRFGGSSYKYSFISEQTPWCIVTMKDRSYFYNRDTKEQYVESISPDKIELVNNGVLLLTNNQDKGSTLYSLSLKKPLLHFDNDILLCTSEILVIMEEEGGEYSLTIFRIEGHRLSEHSITCEAYSICKELNKLYFANQGYVYALSLNTFSEEKVYEEDDRWDFVGFTKGCYTISKRTFAGEVTIKIYDLEKRKAVSALSTSAICIKIENYDFNNENLISKIENLFSLHSQLKIGRYVNIEYTILSIKHIFIQDDSVYYQLEEEIFYIDKYGSHKSKIICRLVNGTQTFEVRLQRWANIEETKDAIYIRDNEWVKVVRDESIIMETVDEMFVSNNGLRLFFSERNNARRIYSYNPIEDKEFFIYMSLSLPDIEKSDIEWKWFNEFNVIVVSKDGNNNHLIIHPQYGTMNLRQLEIDRLKLNNLINCLCIGPYICSKGDVYLLNNKKQMPENVITLSEKCEYALSLRGTHIYMHKLSDNCEEEILFGLFDTSKYEKVFLSDDGENIVYQESDELILLNSKTLKEERFPNLNFIHHSNGYRPLFAIDSYRKLRIIDPLTKQYINNQYLNKYTFCSPNGKLYADTDLNKYVKFYNQIEGRYISQEEYNALASEYEYKWNSDDEEKEKINRRRELFINNNKKYFNNKSITENLQTASGFLRLFILRKGFAVIRNSLDDKIIAEIPLGPELWFLNYVAFSFDSRYVAIGGRYPDYTIYEGKSVGGLMLIYDLLDKRIVINKTSTLAIWSVAFSVKGTWASYSSTPITYMGICCDECINEEVFNRNFLTFSPDGKYIALSDQGYKRYVIDENDWGHQPSTNVYVCLSENPNKNIIPVIKDLADGGLESTCKPKSVASCSFSLDNRKLMMVGNDGVVIIRNINLSN